MIEVKWLFSYRSFPGSLVDKYDSYAPGFYTSGACVIIGGLILLLPTPTNQQQDKSDNGSISTVETVDNDENDDDSDIILEKLSVV